MSLKLLHEVLCPIIALAAENGFRFWARLAQDPGDFIDHEQSGIELNPQVLEGDTVSVLTVKNCERFFSAVKRNLIIFATIVCSLSARM